jgi:hypothetical protein
MGRQQESQGEIAVVRSGTAPKANGSLVYYDIGHERATGRVLIRVVGNDGGGTFSKEFVPFSGIKRAVDDAGGRKSPFRGGDACQQAYKGKSRNNGSFLAYALRGEGLLAKASEKDSMVLAAGDWDAWERDVRAIPLPAVIPPPPPGDDEGAKPPAKGKGSKKKKATKAEPSPPDTADARPEDQLAPTTEDLAPDIAEDP